MPDFGTARCDFPGGSSEMLYNSIRKILSLPDATLGMPRLILPSLQVTMQAGQMPEPDAQGDVFLKLPINKL